MSELKDMKQDVAQEDNKVPDNEINLDDSSSSQTGKVGFRIGNAVFATEQFVIDSIENLKKELEKKLENKG